MLARVVLLVIIILTTILANIKLLLLNLLESRGPLLIDQWQPPHKPPPTHGDTRELALAFNVHYHQPSYTAKKSIFLKEKQRLIGLLCKINLAGGIIEQFSPLYTSESPTQVYNSRY